MDRLPISLATGSLQFSLLGTAFEPFLGGKTLEAPAIQLLKPKLICEATHCKK